MPLPSGHAVRLRGATLVWLVFAAVIVVATLLKPDEFVLKSGERFSGTVAQTTANQLLVRVSGDDSGDVRRVPLVDIVQHSRLGSRSVTPVYHRAAEQWWGSQPLYTEGVHGFLYLPQAAMAYSPFTYLPPELEETLWRLLGIGLYAAGVLGLCRRAFGREWANAFFLASLLAVPAAIGSAANGQTNLHLAGMFALAAADLIGKRWWRATLWLVLALALKPTALVLILLAGAIYLRPMAWRLAIGIAALALVPFLHSDPHYVLGQYQDFAEKLQRAGAPMDRFQDIRGMLMDWGIVRVRADASEPGGFVESPPEIVLTAVRAAAALGTLGLCWLASRRFGDAARGLFLLTLGIVYLMLFNPRTEGVTYAMLGPVGALWGARELIDKRWPTAAYLIFLCLVLQFSMQVTLGKKNYWVRPLATIVFAGMVVAEIARGRTSWDRAPDAGASGRVTASPTSG